MGLPFVCIVIYNIGANPINIASSKLIVFSMVFMLCNLPCRADTTQLQIKTMAGMVEFNVVIASTPEQWQRGLMFQKSLANNVGMLFDYHQPIKVSMWMKNTAIPLDMLFINQQGVVVNVHHSAVPYSEEIISSQQPVRAVLEINAGLAKQFSIEPGAKILHAIFIDESQ